MKKMLICFLLIFGICLTGCVLDEDKDSQTQSETENEESETRDKETIKKPWFNLFGKDTEETTENKTEPKPEPEKINISQNSDFATLYSEAKGPLCISGSSQSVKLTLPSTVSLKDDLTISNVTLDGNSTVIYANGHKLTVSSNVKSVSRNTADRLTVYGGGRTAVTGDTDIEFWAAVISQFTVEDIMHL